ncbi:MAG TPA: chemotaxis protein CheW [Solirubrobacterales bacterium]|jgi:chemotaxis signal transduction protein|nr:chemotaxis protein CheW [Solirubrobacterales bacterium]
MSGVHVRVRAGGEHYALPVEGVCEVAKLGPLTSVPGAPGAVLGVWNLRGDVMAVIDLATLLGLETGERGRIVVAEVGDRCAGLAVEFVVDVGSVPRSRDPAESEYLAGAVLIDRTPVGIVDLGAVLGALSPEAAG